MSRPYVPTPTRGVTIVFVSHAIGMVQQLCDQVAWMDHGVLQQVGDPAEVCNAYMAHVNAIEASRLTGEADRVEEATGPDESQRRGTGEIQVVDIEYIDPESGESVAVAVSGEPFAVRLHYQANERFEAPVVIVDIFHESGTHVTGPSNVAVSNPIHEINPGARLYRLLPRSGRPQSSETSTFRRPSSIQASCIALITGSMPSHSLCNRGFSSERAGLVASGGQFGPVVPLT
ncbi:MAG: Wzt carbohydrate-binding domain-containing protein [Acidimicrobiales bacterium]